MKLVCSATARCLAATKSRFFALLRMTCHPECSEGSAFDAVHEKVGWQRYSAFPLFQATLLIRMSATPRDESLVKPEKSKRVWELLPDILEFIRPRRGLLAVGFVLMVINRASGLVLPGSSKFLIDNVITKRQIHLLLPLVLAVVGATALQGITDYSLTQLLSK
jgi:ABC-type bacteriocin/lantibiotic exporter with double-glycine peptidase domain